MAYIAVTADEYETIVHIEDTQAKMAEVVGVSIPVISVAISRGYTVRGEYKIYAVEDGEE